jgi:hypothetical protein
MSVAMISTAETLSDVGIVSEGTASGGDSATDGCRGYEAATEDGGLGEAVRACDTAGPRDCPNANTRGGAHAPGNE